VHRLNFIVLGEPMSVKKREAGGPPPRLWVSYRCNRSEACFTISAPLRPARGSLVRPR
jgi:hypothetical protein